MLSFPRFTLWWWTLPQSTSADSPAVGRNTTVEMRFISAQPRPPFRNHFGATKCWFGFCCTSLSHLCLKQSTLSTALLGRSHERQSGALALYHNPTLNDGALTHNYNISVLLFLNSYCTIDGVQQKSGSGPSIMSIFHTLPLTDEGLTEAQLYLKSRSSTQTTTRHPQLLHELV